MALPSPGATCTLQATSLPAGAREAVGHRHHQRLLQAQHVGEVRMVLERMHDRQLGGAGIAEQMRDALVLQEGEKGGAAGDAVHEMGPVALREDGLCAKSTHKPSCPCRRVPLLSSYASSSRRRISANMAGRELHADAGLLGQPHIAIDDRDVVGEAAVGLEHAGIAFRAAELQAGRDVERQLVAAVRDQAAARPAVASAASRKRRYSREAVGQRRVDLHPVAVGAQAAVAQQVVPSMAENRFSPVAKAPG